MCIKICFYRNSKHVHSLHSYIHRYTELTSTHKSLAPVILFDYMIVCCSSKALYSMFYAASIFSSSWSLKIAKRLRQRLRQHKMEFYAVYKTFYGFFYVPCYMFYVICVRCVRCVICVLSFKNEPMAKAKEHVYECNSNTKSSMMTWITIYMHIILENHHI